MSIEGQPNTILTVYSPFAWIEDTTTATVTGSFINFPTAQNNPISFPNTITANKVESSEITTIDNAPLNIGTFVGRTRTISIGTGMTSGNITLGTASVIVNAVNMNTGFLSCNTDTALEIGNIIGRSANIKIAENMASGEVRIGSTSSLTKMTNIASDNTMDIQNSDLTGEGRISISCGDERLGNIDIGVNTNTLVGRTTGSVNIMNGVGRQEGSFNVLTNANNRGNIVLGNTTNGNITINAKLASQIPMLQNVAFPANNTTYLLGTDVANITTATIVVDQNNQYVGRFVPFIAGTGKMLMTAVITFTANQLTPYLHFRAYRRATTISINTTVVPGTDTELAGIKWTQRYYTTGTGDIMTAILTGTYSSNPLLNTTANAIGIAVQNLTASPSTLTLSAVNSYVTVYRIG